MHRATNLSPLLFIEQTAFGLYDKLEGSFFVKWTLKLEFGGQVAEVNEFETKGGRDSVKEVI
jgi:hypothetical protein